MFMFFFERVGGLDDLGRRRGGGGVSCILLNDTGV